MKHAARRRGCSQLVTLVPWNSVCYTDIKALITQALLLTYYSAVYSQIISHNLSISEYNSGKLFSNSLNVDLR